MVAAEAVSYLALLAGTCGAYGAGRGSRGAFLWLRRLAVVVLAGVLVAVQVRLVAFGFVGSPVGYVAGSVALAGIFALLAVDLLREDLAGSAAARSARTGMR